MKVDIGYTILIYSSAIIGVMIFALLGVIIYKEIRQYRQKKLDAQKREERAMLSKLLSGKR